MKAFRGTFLALLALFIVGGAWLALRPEPAPTPVKKDKKEEGIPLFKFEKADLVKVEVVRDDRTIRLEEKADGWYLEGETFRASQSMVNRVKHQLHDLVSRATVIDDAEAPALYGLGEGAIHVTLTFRDGTSRTFDAGDPNPSGVSFYIRPQPEGTIYTVKKSAVDYYALSLEEFRERRFATFDSKDVDALEARRKDGVVLKFQRTGEHTWDMTSPAPYAASDNEVRSLMGRVSAMKAIKFVTDDDSDLARYGLDAPRLDIRLTFSGREDLRLLVGGDSGETDGSYPLAYAKLADEPTIFAVRDGLLEDYYEDPSAFRLTRFVRMDGNRVSQIVATWSDTGKDKDLNKTVTVRMAANTWMWDDGVPVPGSTPKRVATRAAGLDADAFVAAVPDDKRYGFDAPLAKLVLSDLDGATRTLLVGKPAPAVTDPEGNERERYYARVAEYPEVYIVDSGVVEVTKDLMREHRRKADGDAAEEERHDQIEAELGPLAPPSRDRDDPRLPPGRRPERR